MQNVCLRHAARQRPAGNVEKLSCNYSLDSPPITGLLEKYNNLLIPADYVL